jgi:hypothetical protein
MGQASDFIGAFFAGMPEGQHILVWTAREQARVSHWGDSVAAAASIAEAEAAKSQNTYFGVGTRRRGKHLVPDKRGEDKDVAYLYGMWVDIDWMSDAHQKQNLPADEDEAYSILEAVPLDPSIVVRSGHGLQAYWLFDEPLPIGLGMDAAKRMTMRWNYTFKRFAQRCGWDVDSVFDLARVMRVPGSRNVKNGGDVAVEIVTFEPDRRYSIYELMDSAIDEDAVPSQLAANSMRAGNLVLNYTAQYNVDKFEALSENNPEFHARWLHKKAPGGDNSMSSYDMSLASMAAYAGWDMQEIVDLLICHRRKYKDLDPNNKEQRFDYLERTARKAWMDAQDSEKREAAKAALVVRPDEAQSKDGDDAPAEDMGTWEALAKVLKIDIRGMKKFLADEPTYRILIGDGEYEMGTIENITSWVRFQNKVATHTGRAIPRFKPQQWADIWSRILMSAVSVSIADGGSAEVLYSDRFAQWMDDQVVLTVDAEVDITDPGHIYKCDGSVYFQLDDFYRWLKLYHHDNVTRGVVAKVLRQMNARPKHISIVRDGKKSSRNMWVYLP